jgi:molybdopterin synthase sulfur carrier subunit
MAVTVRLFAAARSAAGTDAASADPGTLATVIDDLLGRYPDLAPVMPRCSFLVDGTAVHGQAEDVVIADGVEIDVLPPFAGG